MRAIANLSAGLLAGLLIAVPSAFAQQPDGDAGFDLAGFGASVQQMLQRASDRDVDGLFQAVHASARQPREADALCTLLSPDGDRSLDGMNTFVSQLGTDSQQRFADAIAQLVIAGLQGGQSTPYDAVAARQALKANATRATFLHDGFIEGLQADPASADGRAARCQSLRWMLDVLEARPLPERALVTRLLLSEGLARMASDLG